VVDEWFFTVVTVNLIKVQYVRLYQSVTNLNHKVILQHFRVNCMWIND